MGGEIDMILMNGYTFGAEKFNSGEVSYKPVEIKKDHNTIELFFEDNKDITDLIFLVDYIRDVMGFDTKLTLKMLYVPYGRMDRQIDGYLFSLKYFKNIINKMYFNEVITLDNHSKQTEEYLMGFVEEDLNPYIEKVLKKFWPDYICFPDKGAYSKYPKKIKKAIDGIKYFYGEKERVLDDSRKISRYKLNMTELSMEGKKVLIIDDICCTGGTAMIAAQEMRDRGASEINLWASHCESNVIKYDIVREGSPITKIYTSGSINRRYNIPEIETIVL